MNDLKIAVLGVNSRGAMGTLAHFPNKGSRVVALCDIAQSSLDRAKEWYEGGVLTTKERKDLYDMDLDAVMICTPDRFHEEHAVEVLSHGIPVFLEKPMSLSIEGCDRILKAAHDHKTKLYLGHNMRHMTFVKKMKELIDDGAIGEVRGVWCRHFIGYGGDYYFKNHNAEREKSIGMLLQKGAHDIDVIHYLTGARTKKVSAFGNLSVYNRCETRPYNEPANTKYNESLWPPLQNVGMNPKMDIEDHTLLMMEMEGDILASYNQCHYTPDTCRNYTIIGTEGRIENIGDGPRSPIFLWNRKSNTSKMIGDEVHYGDKIDHENTIHGGADQATVKDFLAYIKGEVEEAITCPIWARHAVATGIKGTESLRSGGQPLEVPDLPRDLTL